MEQELLNQYDVKQVLDFIKSKEGFSEYDFILKCANYVSTYKLDENSIKATLLLKPYEQGFISMEEIVELTNEETVNLISSVGNLSKIDTESKENEAEKIREMFIALAKDIRVIIINLVYILETLKQKKAESEDAFNRLCDETKDIFAPLAGRLGLSRIKSELEDLVLMYTQPDIYESLLHNVELSAKEREAQLELTMQKLNDMLKELNINGTISGRKKHFASIVKKMKSKTLTLAQIHDLVAVRIIVENIDECYTILGKIHTIYRPIDGRFKDYIAVPKPNGYQSLHTSVIADNGKPLEIQIRTDQMHKIAEYGVAAHWMYKEKRMKATSLDEKLGWVREIMEKNKDMGASDFVEALKVDLYSGKIFVQTPKGKVLEFPEGATVIDFAYAIHSDIGNKCVGSKINGKISPIITELHNGDVVEVLTTTQAKGPSRDWLKHTKTSGAKDKINAYFKHEMKDENIKTGKSILEQTCKNKGLTLSKVLTKDGIESVCRKYNLLDEDDMYACIGYGGVSALQVFNKLFYYYNELTKIEAQPEIKSNVVISKKGNDGAILVRGERDLMTRFAGCCNPIPGDDIIGFVSHGRGITIHKRDCKQIEAFDSDRLIEAAWADNVNSSFNAGLRIITSDKMGFVTKLTPILSEVKAALLKLDTFYTDDKLSVYILVSVKDIGTLNTLIKNIKRLPYTEDVFRA